MIERNSLKNDIQHLELIHKIGFAHSKDTRHGAIDSGQLERLVDFSGRAGLDVIHAMVLVLKWCMEKIPESQRKKAFSRLDIDRIHHVFINDDHYNPDTHGFTLPVFADTIHEMVVSDINKKSITDLSIKRFASRRLSEVEAIRLEAIETAESYLTAKTRYFNTYEALGDISYEVQSQQLENRNIVVRYRTKFPEVIDVRQFFFQLEHLKLQRAILESDSTLSMEQALEMTAEKRFQTEKQMNDLRLDASLGERKAWMLNYNIIMDADSLEREKEKGKRLARQIAMLTHDDVVKKNPNYTLLTENQKQDLRECFDLAINIKNSEIGCSPIQVGFDLRSSVELQSILNKVKKILANAGIDMNIDHIPVGETLAEKRDWFIDQTQLLEALILQAKAKLVQLLNDPDVKENRNHLACPELYDKIKAGLKKLAEKYKEESRLQSEAIMEMIHSNEA